MNRIFLITTGRSGTYWLSGLMAASTNLPLTGNPEFFSTGVSEQDRVKEFEKIWSNLPSAYMSTSLIPRNGYLDLLSDVEARFVYLKRDVRKAAYSMYRMSMAPYRGRRGKWYQPDPKAHDNMIRMANPYSLTDYQLCLWACVETREVAERIKDKGCDFFEFDIEEINHPTDFMLLENFLKWLQVEYDLDIAKTMIGKRVNVLKRYYGELEPEIKEADRNEQEKEFAILLAESRDFASKVYKGFSKDLE